MGTKLERIAEISATTPKPEFTSLYHLINAEMPMQCHKEPDGKMRPLGIASYEDKITDTMAFRVLSNGGVVIEPIHEVPWKGWKLFGS